jgi:hypothetical protein
MSSRVDALLEAYKRVVREPWSSALSGQERMWFLVYDPAEQRKVDLRIGEFELITRNAGKKWVSISLKGCFPEWMAKHDYRDEYFQDPESLTDQLELSFKGYATTFISEAMDNLQADNETVVVIRDIASVFGFSRVSDILNGCSGKIKGRMLILFPGEFANNHYRLLDARDGWSYLARPITA